jgi:hypothetical protein
MSISYRHYSGEAARDVLRTAVQWSCVEVLNPCGSERAVAAYDGEKLVGVFGYSRGTELSWRPGNEERMLNAEGTHVRTRYRKLGIGTELWCQAITRWKANEVRVFVVSSAAVRMLRQVEKRLPHVQIDASFGDGPKGRQMTSAKRWRERERARVLISSSELRY